MLRKHITTIGALALLLFFSPILRAQPGSGKCLDLNGTSSYVSVPATNLNGTGLTMQAWVNVDNFKSAFPYITSVMGTETTGNTALLRIGDASLASDRPQFVIQIGSSQIKLDATTGLSSDTWYHLAVTYDGSTMRLYINGVLNASYNTSGAIVSNDVFALGRNYGNDRVLDGMIDEASVWGTALSQATIRDWMCKKITPSHPNYNSLKGYWTLDEGSGTTTADMSGNALDGTLNASPTWKNSGAPIGDRSKHIYASSFSLGISHPQGDSIHFTSSGGTMQGVHVYRVDSVPYVTAVPAPLQYLDSSHYWGIFVAGSATFNGQLYYDGNTAISNSDDCFIGIARRNDGGAATWSNQSIGTVDYTNEIVGWSTTSRSEYAVAISANGPHTFTFDLDMPACNGGNDGAVTMHVNGGLPPYDFVWENSSTDSTSSGLTAGYHSFTVTDDNGCVSMDSVLLNQPSVVGVNPTVVNATCNVSTNGSIHVVAAGGTPGYTYLWSNTGGATTATLNNIGPGTYTVTVTDANSCTADYSFEVNSIGPDPKPHLGPDTNVCGEPVFGLTATVTGGPATSYAWSTGGTAPIQLVTGTGTYSLTVTNSAGCQGADTIEVTYVTPQQVSLGNNVTATGSATLQASAGFLFYQWSNGMTGQNITVTQSGSYSVTATDTNGCESSDTVQVTIKPAGVGQLSYADRISVFPNPASYQVVLESVPAVQAATTVELLDLCGRVVQTDAYSSLQKATIDVSSLHNGQYFLRVTTGDFTTVKTFVVQH